MVAVRCKCDAGKEGRLLFRSAGEVYEIDDEHVYLKSLVLEGRELVSVKRARLKRWRVLLASKQVLEAKLRSDYVKEILGLD